MARKNIEISSAFFSLISLTSWGTKEDAVNIPAAIPIHSVKCSVSTLVYPKLVKK